MVLPGPGGSFGFSAVEGVPGVYGPLYVSHSVASRLDGGDSCEVGAVCHFSNQQYGFWAPPSPGALSRTVRGRCFYCGSSVMPAGI